MRNTTQHQSQKPPLDAAVAQNDAHCHRATPVPVCASAARDTTHEGKRRRREETAAENSKSRPALPCLGVLIFTHSSLFRRSSRRFVVRARLSVPTRESKKKTRGKTSRTSRVFPSGFFGDRILCCRFCKVIPREERAGLRA